MTNTYPDSQYRKALARAADYPSVTPYNGPLYNRHGREISANASNLRSCA